ncbi:MAG: hypothetical protein WCJ64_13825 [Rhodospirillaceae bacterium]
MVFLNEISQFLVIAMGFIAIACDMLLMISGQSPCFFKGVLELIGVIKKGGKDTQSEMSSPPSSWESSLDDSFKCISTKDTKNLNWLKSRLAQELSEGKITEAKYHKFIDVINRNEKHASVKVDMLRNYLVTKSELTKQQSSHKHYHSDSDNLNKNFLHHEKYKQRRDNNTLTNILESIKPVFILAAVIAITIYGVTYIAPMHTETIINPYIQYGPRSHSP